MAKKVPSKAPKRTKYNKEHDKAMIAKLLIRRLSVRNICIELNRINKENGGTYTLSYTQVFADSKEIFEEWKSNRKEFIDNVIDHDMAELNEVQKEAWIAWEKSKKGTKPGDPRFLDKILQSLNLRKDIVGYAAPKSVEVNHTLGVGVLNMDKDDISKEKRRILDIMSESTKTDVKDSVVSQPKIKGIRIDTLKKR